MADAAGRGLPGGPRVARSPTCATSATRALHLSGGAITAALFLREFVGGRPWAHLDIAGPARADKDEDELVKGGTGFAVRTLLRWLEAGARA